VTGAGLGVVPEGSDVGEHTLQDARDNTRRSPSAMARDVLDPIDLSPDPNEFGRPRIPRLGRPENASIVSRAAAHATSFRFAGTASSRSRIIASHPDATAFMGHPSLWPGTNNSDRNYLTGRTQPFALAINSRIPCCAISRSGITD
jgi:hypothetical protein